MRNSKFLIACIACSIFCVLLSACATAQREEDMKIAETHYKLGISYMEKDQINEAFIEFQKAIKLNPEHKESLNLLGYVSARFKKYDDAIDFYKRAISISSDYSDAMNNLGVAYVELENWDEAIKYSKMALKNPVYATPEKPYLNMGYAYYKKGDYASAIDAINKAALRYPQGLPQSNYYLNYILGLIYVKLGKADAAIYELKKAEEIAPGNIDVHWELANAYMSIGDNENAIRHFKAVSESDADKEKSRAALEYIKRLKE
ncbi:MAG: tetratricopeptide repeat protein [Nitrospirota bacterium]